MWKFCVHDDNDDNDDDDDNNDNDDDDDYDDDNDNDDDDDNNGNDDDDDDDDDNDDDDPVVPVSWWRAVGVFEQLGRLAGRSVGRPHQSSVCSVCNTIHVCTVHVCHTSPQMQCVQHYACVPQQSLVCSTTLYMFAHRVKHNAR